MEINLFKSEKQRNQVQKSCEAKFLNLYPLKFKPLYLPKPWGGQKLKLELGRDIPPHSRIGESWEISDRGGDSTSVINGKYAGMTLHSLIKNLGPRLLGDSPAAHPQPRFPLLYKILDVEALLSLQVHPPDGYSGLSPGEGGKTEFWYVLSAGPKAKVVSGLKEGMDRVKFERLLKTNHPEKAVREISIRQGDGIFIPAGRVHTISPSCLILEIQQNSNTTYRISDWGRMGLNGRPRSLHLKSALEVINFEDASSALVQPLSEKEGSNTISFLLICPYFTVELLDLQENYSDACRGDHFQVLSCVEGRGTIDLGGPSPDQWSLRKGDFYLLPAYLGPYRLIPEETMTVLKSYVS